MAAVLACGPGAALSHTSAAALWNLRPSAAEWIDVAVPRTGRRSRHPIRIHRPRTLDRVDVTTHDGIPVTTPARTILDLAADLQRAHLERLLDQSEIQELADYRSLDALARACSGHHGSRRLLAALGRHDAGAEITRSDLEVHFRQLCHDHGLPQPHVNQTVADTLVDFLFESARLVVETDSWRFHRTRRAFEDDRARDARLVRAGYRTLRFTDRQITGDPHTVVATLRAAGA
jgi:very-short-patch-repair endonuclease